MVGVKSLLGQLYLDIESPRMLLQIITWAATILLRATPNTRSFGRSLLMYLSLFLFSLSFSFIRNFRTLYLLFNDVLTLLLSPSNYILTFNTILLFYVFFRFFSYSPKSTVNFFDTGKLFQIIGRFLLFSSLIFKISLGGNLFYLKKFNFDCLTINYLFRTGTASPYPRRTVTTFTSNNLNSSSALFHTKLQTKYQIER